MAFPLLAALFGGAGAMGGGAAAGGAAGGAGWMEIIKQLGGGGGGIMQMMSGGGGAPQGGGAPLMSAQGPPAGQWNPNVNLGGGAQQMGPSGGAAGSPAMGVGGGGGGGGGTPGAKMARQQFQNVVDSTNMVFDGLHQFGTSLAGSDKRPLNNIHRNTPPVITPEQLQNPSGIALNALMAKIAGLG